LILDAFQALTPVSTVLDAALGRVLAETVVARDNLPPFTNAAMDGYALLAVDTYGATSGAPTRLRVVGEIAAGAVSPATVRSGTAIRIMTGAPLPPGADAVVRFEETDDGRDTPGHVLIGRQATAGRNVRPAGEDVAAGTTVLSPGARLFPAEIGLLASLGHATIRTHPQPRIAILATGDEVVPHTTTPGPGQIRDSNGPTLAALVRQAGGVTVDLGIARDTTNDLRTRLSGAAAAGADLILTVGGVSVGDYDLVKQVLRADGRIELWQVRIKPGKPLAFGWLGETPLIGLPGNPVAALVAFHQFVRPAILTMLGRSDLTLPTIHARLMELITNPGGRRHFVRVQVRPDPDGVTPRYTAHLAGPPGAGRLSSLIAANGLLILPEDRAAAEPGDIFQVQMPDWDLG